MRTPDPALWSTEEWYRAFERAERRRSPMIAAMEGRSLDAPTLSRAIELVAHRPRTLERSSRFALVARPLRRHLEDEPSTPCWPPSEDASSDPSLAPGGPVDTAILDAQCPVYRRSRVLHREILRRARADGAQVAASTHYVLELLASAQVVVALGRHWSRALFSDAPLAAAFRVASGRFRTVSRVLRRHASSSRPGLADEAAAIARGFCSAAKAWERS